MSWTCATCTYAGNVQSCDECMLCATLRNLSLVPHSGPSPAKSPRPAPSAQASDGLRLYRWQEEALAAIKQQNTIVMIPTGGGKTLVAVKAIDHFGSLHAGKKVMFVVPTVALVHQQATYCEQRCEPTKRTARLFGPAMDSWTQRQWSDCLATCDIVVGTPAVFQSALVTTGYIHLSQFYLLVFDECHNAVGNSPMVAIMTHVIAQVPPKRPTILGLTGSFNNGSMANVEKKKTQLELVLTAQMCCPSMADFESQQNKAWISVQYDGSDCTAAGRSLVEGKTDLVLSPWATRFRDQKLKSRLLATAVAVYENLGLAGWSYYVREGIVKQLIEDSQAAEQYGGKGVMPASTLIQFREYLRGMVDSVGPELTRLPSVSNKFRRLLQLLMDKKDELFELRVLVFVERIASTNPLADLLNRDFANHEELVHLRAAAVCGTGAMSDAEREERLTEFRRGKLAVLVCTCSLEEGIDVPECNLVVRFDEFKTTKQHIQGSGRARCPNAQIFYFENNIQTEVANQVRMEKVARDHNITITPEEIEEDIQARPVCTFHPFKHASGAWLDIFNALNVVYEYIQKTMHIFSPEALWGVRTEVVKYGPPMECVEIVEAFRYPSPDGVISIDFAQVKAVWGSIQVREIVEEERIKRWTSTDTEKRRFLFVAAIDMVKRGYLDENNLPTGLALQETKLRCPPYRLPSGMRIRYDYKNADESGRFPSSAPPPQSTSPTTIHVARPLAQPSSSISASSAIPRIMPAANFPFRSVTTPIPFPSTRSHQANCSVPAQATFKPAPRFCTLTPNSQTTSQSVLPGPCPLPLSSSSEPESVKRKVLKMLSSKGPMLLASFVQEYSTFFQGKEDLDAVLRTIRVGTFLFTYCGCSKVGPNHFGPPQLQGGGRSNVCSGSVSSSPGRTSGGSCGSSNTSSCEGYRCSENIIGYENLPSCSNETFSPSVNYKGQLQEKLVSMFEVGLYAQPQYVSRDIGTCQFPEFEARLCLTLPWKTVEFSGRARTKKAAEQLAACNSLAAVSSW